MLSLVRTDANNKDFEALVKHLDSELAERDGEEHAFYNQFNKVTEIKYVVVAYQGDLAISCGAIKAYDDTTMEIKRMYTSEAFRGKGIASKVLAELEQWTSELSFKKCMLETGLKQPEAIKLYKKNGYNVIPNYGQYAEVENSVCFQKILK
ncbi:acetyltransferase (GNAT) family [Formosa agariphila KMM 3901]|uniref:Acetyltransferase (GNAT) family n=1 Tax=Formosa agariphila (strain DSM 15362 / KCTC 12365 / LMG 23005 / KMM 3901 / M-2Alg 35-1) TaxID=1347342 RepID=T2KHV6_FORAG|nr:GNAT family N-acetyltransferase [Formosa agariphila]CDF77998.1 acetyltransferase (GNAT) family [Formosa agariphila KMM 3901]